MRRHVASQLGLNLPPVLGWVRCRKHQNQTNSPKPKEIAAPKDGLKQKRPLKTFLIGS